MKNLFQRISWAWWHIPRNPDTWDDIFRKDWTKAKGARDLDQVVEHLPNKYKALSSKSIIHTHTHTHTHNK
jgi:hypothetical protein